MTYILYLDTYRKQKYNESHTENSIIIKETNN
jgi:hypothetical protein